MASSSTAIGTVGLVAIQRQVRNLLSGINTERAVSEGRLIHELGEGGYVVVMAKASPPTVLPSESIAARGNPSLERQLDEYGQNTASAMGEALKRLEIPIGAIFNGPEFRAIETVRYTRFGTALAL